MSRLDLTHHFLIAMPRMVDPNFARTVTYVCEHNDQGALGLVINRPIGSTYADLFEQVGIELKPPRLRTQPIYFGGPVQQDRGFVLHRPIGAWKSTLPVRDVLGFTTSRDVLEALGGQLPEAPKDVLITLGYAGWAPGQLEHEIAQNAWLWVEADPRVIFGEPPEARYDAAIKLLGFDPGRLLDVAGHA